jgi:hypothetical protein
LDLKWDNFSGFHFPPNNLPNWPTENGAPTPGEDGLVIDFRAVGANNPNTILNPGTSEVLVVKGATPVHEMATILAFVTSGEMADYWVQLIANRVMASMIRRMLMPNPI